MDEFRKLWKEFLSGTKSLAYHRTKGKTPFFAREKERFEKRIVAPMDAAWVALSDADKKSLEMELGL